MKKEIGKNVSSGAKKVEKIEAENISPESVNEKTPAKKRTSSAKKSASTKRAVKKEHAAADKRVKAAKARASKKEEKIQKRAALKQAKIEKRAALKQKKLEKKQRLAEKRLAKRELLAKKRAERIEKRQTRRADLKAKRVEKRAERAARREMLKNESKAERNKRLAREKKERFALKAKRREARERDRERKLKAREAAHARRAEERKHKREQRTERKKHAPGFGGWLAAVISLGTACLALATIVTAGAIRMGDMQLSTESGYRNTLYDMVSVSDDLDDNLSKLRVSSGASEQRALLSQILVDTHLMESALGRIPVDQQTSTDISGFVNETGTKARSLLAKLATGGTLTASEKEEIGQLYSTNNQLYGELNELATHLDKGDFRAFVNGKKGTVSEKFGNMGAGIRKSVEETDDAPFADEGNVGENRLARFEEITSSEAEEVARTLFEAYHIREAKLTGETYTQEVTSYNFLLTTEDDLEIFVEITKNGGKLAFFNTYEECHTKNFDLETCDAIARAYLNSIGIGNVEAVWLSDGGMVANLTYTTVQDGVRIYPEIIRIRVCEEKGRVVGMDARGYLLNEKDRSLKATLSASEAKAKLTGGLEPYAENLALIPVGEKEVLAYEFACKYGEEEYIVYLDAKTGEEVQIFRVRESAQGRYLK